MEHLPDFRLFIVPSATRREQCRLLRIDAAGQAQLLPGSLPFPYISPRVNRAHAISDNWVVGVRPGPYQGEYVSNRIVRARIDANGKRMLLPEIAMPDYWCVKCLLLHGDWLYIGGGYDITRGWDKRPSGESEFLQRLNLNAASPVLEMVPLPVEFGAGKAIDDLLREGDELLVVDDIVYPKYLFSYQLQPNFYLPQWKWTHQLPFKRTYEHIRRACWNAQFIVLLSSSSGMGGTGTYVSVLRRTDFKPVFITKTYWYSLRRSESATNPDWSLSDVALQDNQLILACGGRGVARVWLYTAPLWPKQRVSYQSFPIINAYGHLEAGKSQRIRKTVLADGLNLDKATAADGVEWLPLAPGQPPVETVQFIGPGQLLLTGRHDQKKALAFWIQQLPV